MDLRRLRAQIDALDAQLLELLSQRFEAALRLRPFKDTTTDQAREAEVIERALKQKAWLVRPEFCKKLLGLVMEESRLIQETQRPIVGIQGGPGSFSELGAKKVLKEAGYDGASIRYLYTAAEVFTALKEGTIDYGVCGIRNSTAGDVEETVAAHSIYSPRMVLSRPIPIEYSLLVLRADSQVQEIMGHPLALRQCQHTLANHYPDVPRLSLGGPAADPSKLCQLLVEGQLSDSTAVIGSRVLAEIYGLALIDQGLQDDPLNQTEFALLARSE